MRLAAAITVMDFMGPLLATEMRRVPPRFRLFWIDPARLFIIDNDKLNG